MLPADELDGLDSAIPQVFLDTFVDAFILTATMIPASRVTLC
jgi:hypothetical protein